MSFAENSIHLFDLSKSEELNYQLSESKYHLKHISLSLQEAMRHLKKYHSHISSLKVCIKNFNKEV